MALAMELYDLATPVDDGAKVMACAAGIPVGRGHLHRVHVRAEEQDLPAVDLLLLADHRLDLAALELAGGILEAVGGDHGLDDARAFALGEAGQPGALAPEGGADSVQQRGAAAWYQAVGRDVGQGEVLEDDVVFGVELVERGGSPASSAAWPANRPLIPSSVAARQACIEPDRSTIMMMWR